MPGTGERDANPALGFLQELKKQVWKQDQDLLIWKGEYTSHTRGNGGSIEDYAAAEKLMVDEKIKHSFFPSLLLYSGFYQWSINTCVYKHLLDWLLVCMRRQ